MSTYFFTPMFANVERKLIFLAGCAGQKNQFSLNICEQYGEIMLSTSVDMGIYDVFIACARCSWGRTLRIAWRTSCSIMESCLILPTHGLQISFLKFVFSCGGVFFCQAIYPVLKFFIEKYWKYLNAKDGKRTMHNIAALSGTRDNASSRSHQINDMQ